MRSALLLALALSLLGTTSPTTAEAQLGALLRGARGAAKGASRAGGAARRAGGAAAHGASGTRAFRGLSHGALAGATAATLLRPQSRAAALFHALPDGLPRATYLTGDGFGGFRAIGSVDAPPRFGTSATNALEGVHEHGTAIVLDLPAAAHPERLTELQGPLYVMDAAGNTHPVRRVVDETGASRFMVEPRRMEVDAPTTRSQPGELPELAAERSGLADDLDPSAHAPEITDSVEDLDLLEEAVDLATDAVEQGVQAATQQDQEEHPPQPLNEFAQQQIEALEASQPMPAMPAMPSTLSRSSENDSSGAMVLGLLVVVPILGFKLWLMFRKK